MYGFRGRPIQLCQSHLARTYPVAMATKICDFQHKINYNSACAGDTPQMLAPTRGLSGSANLMVSVKLWPDDLCCHGIKKGEFYQKICHNFGFIYDSRNFGSMVWFSGSANSTMPVTFGSDIPLLPWQRKFAIFNRKSAITQLVQKIRPRCLHLLGGYRDRPI